MWLGTVLSLAYLVSLTHAWSTFIVPHTDHADDTPALMAALPDYASDASIVFQANTTYNIWSPLTFSNLKNVEVVIQGNLSYPTSIKTVQSFVSDSNYLGAWITFTGRSNIMLHGSTDPDRGWVDSHGQQWWDTVQQENWPTGWLFRKVDTGVIRDVKIYKPIGGNFKTTGSNNLHIYNNTILARDGFSAGGTNLLFEYNYVVNGDDCLVVVSGAKNITWCNNYCEGSYGLSVGSLGRSGQVSSVENVLIENTIMNGTLHATWFKSWAGGNGAAINVTWRNIVFIDVVFPIYVTQNYWDQNLGPRPNSSSVSKTYAVNFTFENFVGTINNTPGYVEGSCINNPCWYYVPNAMGREIIIFDLYPATATNITAKKLFVHTQTGASVTAMCNSSTITSNVGFVCQDSPYIPTQLGC